jgi:peptidoglycan DL-endopeptidase CwlO
MNKCPLALTVCLVMAGSLLAAPSFAQTQPAPASATPAPAAAAPAASSPAPAASPAKAPSMHVMARKQRVEKLQSALNANGAKLTVDGKMGPRTHAVLLDFQKAHNLKATGRPDRETIAALKATG